MRDFTKREANVIQDAWRTMIDTLEGNMGYRGQSAAYKLNEGMESQRREFRKARVQLARPTAMAMIMNSVAQGIEGADIESLFRMKTSAITSVLCGVWLGSIIANGAILTDPNILSQARLVLHELIHGSTLWNKRLAEPSPAKAHAQSVLVTDPDDLPTNERKLEAARYL